MQALSIPRKEKDKHTTGKRIQNHLGALLGHKTTIITSVWEKHPKGCNYTLPIKGCLVPCSLLIAADSSKEMENVEFCVHWLWR